jgi:hypothetical protein
MKKNKSSTCQAASSLLKVSQSLRIVQAKLARMRLRQKDCDQFIQAESVTIRHLADRIKLSSSMQQLQAESKQAELRSELKLKRQRVEQCKQAGQQGISQARSTNYQLRLRMALGVKTSSRRGHQAILSNREQDLRSKQQFCRRVLQEVRRSNHRVCRARLIYSESARQSILDDVESMNRTLRSRASELQQLEQEKSALSRYLAQTSFEKASLRQQKNVLLMESRRLR